MKSLRLPLAIIIVLWVVAEGWFAYYWWATPYFSKSFPSVGIPITAIAIVMIAWTLLRYYVIGLASKSMQGKLWGIALLLTASVLGGYAPYFIGRILVECDVLRSSFHGESGWPSALCSLFLWLLGAIFFLVCLIEILNTKIAKQHHD
jgi:hypothetical protein